MPLVKELMLVGLAAFSSERIAFVSERFEPREVDDEEDDERAEEEEEEEPSSKVPLMASGCVLPIESSLTFFLPIAGPK